MVTAMGHEHATSQRTWLSSPSSSSGDMWIDVNRRWMTHIWDSNRAPSSPYGLQRVEGRGWKVWMMMSAAPSLPLRKSLSSSTSSWMRLAVWIISVISAKRECSERRSLKEEGDTEGWKHPFRCNRTRACNNELVTVSDFLLPLSFSLHPFHLHPKAVSLFKKIDKNTSMILVFFVKDPQKLATVYTSHRIYSHLLLSSPIHSTCQPDHLKHPNSTPELTENDVRKRFIFQVCEEDIHIPPHPVSATHLSPASWAVARETRNTRAGRMRLPPAPKICSAADISMGWRAPTIWEQEGALVSV